jgi:hypothetical protein
MFVNEMLPTRECYLEGHCRVGDHTSGTHNSDSHRAWTSVRPGARQETARFCNLRHLLYPFRWVAVPV